MSAPLPVLPRWGCHQDLGARPNRNRPPRRRWSPGTGNRAVRGHPVPAPPKRESMRLAAQRLWVGLRLARQARPASNQERSPLAGMSSTDRTGSPLHVTYERPV
ncbi:hypothetical protein SLAGATHOR_4 [Mycobacterium phage Slagathor]|nr:hypothetical protein SEA_ARCANINE_4 [Mycobacterium phage Arcanine]WGH20204.1 hypothetical protein SLAGATHOR_4 [Mycobacterium phage Slagathor]